MAEATRSPFRIVVEGELVVEADGSVATFALAGGEPLPAQAVDALYCRQDGVPGFREVVLSISPEFRPSRVRETA